MITLQVEIEIDETKLSPAIVTGELTRGFALLQAARGVDDSVLSLQISTLTVKASKRRRAAVTQAVVDAAYNPIQCADCSYRAIDIEDLAEHIEGNH